MKRINLFLLLIATFVLCSCTSDLTDEMSQNADGKYVYQMVFDGNAPGYDDTSSRATTKKWANGATVFLYSNSAKLGVATYDGSAWTLTTESLLSGSGSCNAVHIDGVTTTATTVDALKAVYEGDGSWSVDKNTLTLKATLAPTLGRVRLKGSSGTSVSLTGLKTYSKFKVSNGAFTETTNAVSTSIQTSGYTPYIYGKLTNERKLRTNGYNMTCPSGIMDAGTTGWVNYPTSESHTGWVDWE